MFDAKISAEFPFASRYLEVKDSKVHYVEDGEGDPILFIHGNPASAYIWRNIIPHVSPHARAIAVDLIGFGKSDKPDINYGFADSYAYLDGFIEKLGLTNITLVVQDWGSGLGFHYANLHRDKIKAIAFMEAMYKPLDFDALSSGDKIMMRLIRSGLFSWFMLGKLNMFVKNMLPGWVLRDLSKEEMSNYLAPFPTVKSRKPVHVFPRDVPVKGKPDHAAAAVAGYHKWLTETRLPKLFFHADPGVLIRTEDAKWIANNFPNTTRWIWAKVCTLSKKITPT